MADQPDNQQRRNMGMVAIGAAGVIAYLACHDPKALQQRQLMIVGAVIFALGGVQLVTNAQGRWSALMGGVVCAGMSALGFYVAFFGGQLRGGIPFIPDAWNQTFGKVLFGFGACLTAAMALWFFYRVIKPPPK